MEAQFLIGYDLRVAARARHFTTTKAVHSKDYDKERDLVFLLLITAIIVHGAGYGDSYFETQRTNANINQGVFEATKNYFRADDMTSALEKLFKFDHPAGRGLDQSMIDVQNKLTFQSGGESAKDAISSIIQPLFKSGGVFTIHVTSLIESESDQEFQVQVQPRPLFSELEAVAVYSETETNLFGNVLSTGKLDAEIFAAK